MSDKIYIETLKRHFGYDSFRSIQLDIVKSIAAGHDTLGLMPTGGGKSVTFQVPALTMEGVCLVITPLISLMKDQVEHLKAKGIKAEAINSNQSHQEIQKILDNAIYGAVKFLYISPERLSQKLFLAKLYYMKICFITVDEAHCISQWGYDFRPSYLNIGNIREALPDAPVLALTATATPAVTEDIQDKLAFGKYSDKRPNVFRMSFRRDNISYVVRTAEDKDAEMIHILNSVPGSAIVYTRNREKTKTTARLLCDAGISATYYHAGLDFAIKDRRQYLWKTNQTRVIVATNAFGMGIDKPDVRLVIHLDCPDSLEAYFQEAGRGGRDGLRSYAVLLYNKHDRVKLLKHSGQAFPPKDYIRKVYDHLSYFFELAIDTGEGAHYEFNEDLFCTRFHHYPTQMEYALSILQNAGYILYEQDPDSNPRLQINITREELYHISHLSEQENNIITSLLRYYGSLFVDLTYINESLIARKNGITEQQLHVILKGLAQKGIIRYVPRRKVPLLTFTRQRTASERLRFSKEVYEDLRDRLTERINAVLDYAEATDTCRQQLLLDYFGETDADECHHCDICIDKQNTHTPQYTGALQIITGLLSDNEPHLLSDIHALPIPRRALHDALETLIQEKQITIDGPSIRLHKHG